MTKKKKIEYGKEVFIFQTMELKRGALLPFIIELDH